VQDAGVGLWKINPPIDAVIIRHVGASQQRIETILVADLAQFRRAEEAAQDSPWAT
jgi:hypothetical protein